MEAPSTNHRESVIADDELERFLRDGFVLPKARLPHEDAKRLTAACNALLRDNENWHNMLRQPHVPKRGVGREGVVGGEAIFALALHPVIIETARRLVGPNLIFYAAEIFAKPPLIGKSTPWHQDGYTPAVKAGPNNPYPQSVMIWVAVDRSDRENGCMRFIPGTGRNGARIAHGAAGGDAFLNFEVQGYDPDGAVDAILQPGQFSAHDLFVVHGAEANRSSRRRAGVTFQYMRADDYYDRNLAMKKSSEDRGPALVAQRPIWLVLGENKHPANDFTIGHENLEDLDDLAERTRIRLTAELN